MIPEPWPEEFAYLEPENVSKAMDWLLLHAKDARWNIVADSMKRLELDYFRRQISKDGFRL